MPHESPHNAAFISKQLHELAEPSVAAGSLRFMKAGPGGYAEGDRFLGVRVPDIRKLVKSCRGMTQAEMIKLLHSPYHEERLCALLLMVQAYAKGDDPQRAAIYACYLDNTRYINNWDLVDSSAHLIVGPHLAERSRKPLYALAASDDLWERRIAIMATFHFIKQDDFGDTLKIAAKLLGDEHDLIHKAVGWMLREVGNRDRAAEQAFLDKHGSSMPRTMLRYAIEKFPEDLRQHYLQSTR